MKRKLLFIPLLLFAMAAIAETALIVQPLTGQEQANSLSQIGYIQMTPDSLFVFSHSDAMLSKMAIKDVNYIRYGEPSEATGIEDLQTTSACRVYPNPTQDMLIIDNVNCEKAYIFDLDGRLIQSIPLNEAHSAINVKSLPQGDYLLLLNNQTIKFIKQ